MDRFFVDFGVPAGTPKWLSWRPGPPKKPVGAKWVLPSSALDGFPTLPERFFNDFRVSQDPPGPHSGVPRPLSEVSQPFDNNCTEKQKKQKKTKNRTETHTHRHRHTQINTDTNTQTRAHILTQTQTQTHTHTHTQTL